MLARKTAYDDYYNNHAYDERTTEKRRAAPSEQYNTTLRRQVAVLVVMSLFFAFLMVIRSDTFIQSGYKLVQVKKQETQLMKEIDYLEVKLATAKSPERIVDLAQKIGMVSTEHNLYVSLATDKADKDKKMIDKQQAVVNNK